MPKASPAFSSMQALFAATLLDIRFVCATALWLICSFLGPVPWTRVFEVLLVAYMHQAWMWIEFVATLAQALGGATLGAITILPLSGQHRQEARPTGSRGGPLFVHETAKTSVAKAGNQINTQASRHTNTRANRHREKDKHQKKANKQGSKQNNVKQNVAEVNNSTMVCLHSGLPDLRI